MDTNTITSLVNNIGFPIAMCVVLIYAFKEFVKLFITKLNDIESNHAEQIKGITEALNKTTEALNNNTIAFTKLTERLKNNESID